MGEENFAMIHSYLDTPHKQEHPPSTYCGLPSRGNRISRPSAEQSKKIS